MLERTVFRSHQSWTDSTIHDALTGVHGSWRSTWFDAISLTSVCDADHMHGGQAEHDCNLLGRVGIAVQVAITVVCAIVFLCIWQFETPQRPFLTFIFDVSKQVVGSAYGKLYNIAQSVVFASILAVSAEHQDQCVWYLMSITMDCFVLTFLLWGANDYMRPILLDRYGIDIGDYDEPCAHGTDPADAEKSKESPRADEAPQVRMWLAQMAIWLAIITVVRLFCSLILFFVQAKVYELHAGIFAALGLETKVEKLVFAVLIYPIFADTFQIAVQDNFLKKHKA